MKEETDIYNDMTLQEDIQDLAVLEQVLLKAHCPLPDLDAELEKIVGKDEEEGTAAETETTDKPHTRILPAFLGALLGAAAMLAVVFIYNKVATAVPEPSATALNTLADDGTATLATAQDEMITLTLADGTEVKLNSGSQLTYPHHFQGKERRVKLVGEAFFTVKHDAQRPFIVDAGGVLTKDLGTSFNIRAYNDHDCRVTLVEGSVAVLSKAKDTQYVTLTPGQEFSLQTSSNNVAATAAKITTVDTEETTAWADGVFYYHDQPLEAIIADIAAHYQLQPEFRNTAAKSIHLDFSSSRNGTLQETLSLLNDLGIARIKTERGKLVVE